MNPMYQHSPSVPSNPPNELGYPPSFQTYIPPGQHTPVAAPIHHQSQLPSYPIPPQAANPSAPQPQPPTNPQFPMNPQENQHQSQVPIQTQVPMYPQQPTQAPLNPNLPPTLSFP